MASLKLSDVARRDADKPTLRQRAEALRATAARVIRGELKPAPALSAAKDVGPDPVLAAIEMHRRAHAAFEHAVNASDPVWVTKNGGDASTDAMAPATAARDVAERAEVAAWNALFTARPTSSAGLLALIRHIGMWSDDMANVDEAVSAEDAFEAIGDALAGLGDRSVEDCHPVPDPEPVDWHNPPPGFMAYPAIEPTGFVNIREGLRLEARRLLNIAEDEFERHAEHIDPRNHPSCRKGARAKIRRRLRMDELRAAAEPERPEPAGEIDRTGTVYYEDAAGQVFRKPVAEWIAFMAQRLYGEAHQELSRQFNAGCNDLDADGCRALEARLRRELRTDALKALAFQSHKAFEAAEVARYGDETEVWAGRISQARDQADAVDLSGCSTRSLANLYEAFDAKADEWSDMSCLPYAETDEAAHRVLDDEYNRAAFVRDRIVGLLRNREPKDESDRDAVLQAEIQFELKCEGAIRDPEIIARITAAWGA